VYYDHHDGNIYDTVNKFDYGAATDRGARITVVVAPNDSNKVHVWLSGDDFNTSSQNLMYEPPDAHTYSRTVQDFFVPSFDRHIGSAAIQFDHQMEANLALTSLTSYFTSYNRGVTDFFKMPVPIDLLDQNVDTGSIARSFGSHRPAVRTWTGSSGRSSRAQECDLGRRQ